MSVRVIQEDHIRLRRKSSIEMHIGPGSKFVVIVNIRYAITVAGSESRSGHRIRRHPPPDRCARSAIQNRGKKCDMNMYTSRPCTLRLDIRIKRRKYI